MKSLNLKFCEQCQLIHIIISDVKALESVWIIRDTFVASSYEKTLKMDTVQHKLYMKENYDTFAFFKNNHFDTNLLSRLRNVLVMAFNQNDKLPRVILVVLDNDLVRFINHNKHGVALEIITFIEWLADEFAKAVKTRINQRP